MSKMDELIVTIGNALNLSTDDAIKIYNHLEKNECLEWVEDYTESEECDNPLTDVHYEANLKDMINWLYDDFSPYDVLQNAPKKLKVEEFKTMCQLDNCIIFFYGLV